LEGLGVLDADVNDAGEDHGEHQEDAAGQEHVLLVRGGAVFVEVGTVGGEHLVLLGGDTGAGLDDGLAAVDADGDGGDGLGGFDFAEVSGFAAEDEVWREPGAEEAEEGQGEFAADVFGREADAQEYLGFLQCLHGALDDLAVGCGDLEDDDAARFAIGGDGGVLDAGEVDVVKDDESVFEVACAEGGVAAGEQGGDVVDVEAIGTARVKGVDECGEGLFAIGE